MNTIGINTQHPFVAHLLNHHAYCSPGIPRRVPLATLRYYKGIFGIIATCTRISFCRPFTNQDWFDRSYHSIITVERAGGTIEISGLGNLAAQSKPVVMVSNHMSLLETFLLPCLILPFTPMAVVIKKELTEYPGFGRTMSTINHIAVSRDNPRADFRTVMEEGLNLLSHGISVLIFPQSTRNSVFIPSEFNTLGEKLAAKAGCPVIPVAVKTDLQNNGRLIKELGPIDPTRPVRIVFGPPVDPQKDGRQTHDKIIQFIGGQLHDWGLPVQNATPPAGPSL
jgi:1-acyl-sn-glycerol-3-phosphate acyltransferase